MVKLNLTRRNHDEPVESSRIISVLSGKGGVGKTMLAYNLAQRMAEQNLKVLLVDADLTSGNLHIVANVDCSGSIHQFLRTGGRLDSLLTPVTSRLDLVASIWDGREPFMFDSGMAARFISALRTQAAEYDVIIIDHGAAINDATVLMANASDINLLVLIPDLTSITDCYALYRYLATDGADVDCRILLNRVESADEAIYIQKKFAALAERFVGRLPDYIGFIVEDQIFRQALSAQAPIALVASKSHVTQQLTEIAEQLVDGLKTVSRLHLRSLVNSVKTGPETADVKG